MRRTGFTLMEVLAVIIVIGVLSTVGYVNYENTVEDSKAKISRANMEALNTALNIYIIENDQIPGDLTQLPSKYINDAYAQVIKREGAWKMKLAYFIAGLKERNLAYAETAKSYMLNKLAKGDMQLITDPADPTPPSSCEACVSYGLNQALKGLTAAQYNALGDDIVTIGECDVPVFTHTAQLSVTRHKKREFIIQMHKYGQGVTKKSRIRKFEHAAGLDN